MALDAASTKLAASLVDAAYVEQGAASVNTRQKMVRTLLANRRLPEGGLDELSIEVRAPVHANNTPRTRRALTPQTHHHSSSSPPSR